MMKQPKSTKDPSPYQIGTTLPQRFPQRDSRAAGTEVTVDRDKRKKSKKSWIIAVILAGIVGIVIAVYGSMLWSRLQGVFQGDFFGLLFSRPLQTDEYNRSNIVVFGTSEDDASHSGAELADSIMVISFDQETQQGNLISIPRDLWVRYGVDCSLGSEGKINAAYKCGLDAFGGDERKANQHFAEQVSEVIGTDVHYYAKVNYTVIREVVDALGGINVTIDSSDSRGIYDVATKIQLSNGVHHLNGDEALRLSRSRGAFGGYGLATSNFDRERNQQAVVRGIMDKAISSGTLANPAKVLSIVDAVGDNLLTNVQTIELRRIMSVAQSASSGNLVTISLDRATPPLVRTGMYSNQSVVMPSAGIFDYTDIHAAIQAAFSTPGKE